MTTNHDESAPQVDEAHRADVEKLVKKLTATIPVAILLDAAEEIWRLYQDQSTQIIESSGNQFIALSGNYRYEGSRRPTTMSDEQKGYQIISTTYEDEILACYVDVGTGIIVNVVKGDWQLAVYEHNGVPIVSLPEMPAYAILDEAQARLFARLLKRAADICANWGVIPESYSPPNAEHKE